jgi:hypothetical protein
MAIMDSQLKDKIVKSNIEKHKVQRDMTNMETQTSNRDKSREILQDQLVKNELISREVSVSPHRMPQSKTQKRFRMADLDKLGRSNSAKKRKKEQEMRENRRFISRRKKKSRDKKPKKNKKEKKKEMESINEKRENEISMGEVGSNMTLGSKGFGSIKDSKSSQRTEKGKPNKVHKQIKGKFGKKNYTYNEIIQNQETERRKVHQKKVSLTNLGFNTNPKSVDMLIRKKNKKKLAKTASRVILKINVN